MSVFSLIASRRSSSRALVAVAIALFSSVAQSQTIGINLSDSARITVAPSAKVTVPILIDLSTATGGLNIASLQADLSWGSTRLTFDSLRVVGASGFSLTSNLTNAATGSISFNGFSATALAASGGLANAYFTASATTGGTRLSLNATAAGNELGGNILSQLRLRALDVCVAPSGRWGDANGDGTVNIIDAQQIARASVGLSTANPTAVAERGDVTADGNVNILDAQQIARFSVGLSAAARVNTALFTPPPVTSVVINSVIDISSGVAPSTPINPSAMAVGKLGQINAEPRDAGSASLIGCAAITYSSSVPGVATVSSSGVITAVGAGSTVITVTSGGQTATINLTVVAGGGGGAVASLELVDGPDLTAYPNVITGVPLRIRVKNAGGGVVPGASVTITMTGGGGLVGDSTTFRNAGAGTAPIVVVSDANGIVRANVWGGTAASTVQNFSAAATGATTQNFTVTTTPIRLAQNTCIGDFRQIRCWGNGSRGQLGNGTNNNSLTPVVISTGGIDLANSAVSQEGFGDHSCLTTAAGAVYCWGMNSNGQLGDSTFTDRNVPTLVKTNQLFDWTVTGSEHTCGMTKTGGEIWCWGSNWAGQLGDSTAGNRRFAPVKVKAPAGVVFVSMNAGSSHTCGGTAADVWYCWGLNTSGQLGNGQTVNSSLPVQVGGGVGFKQVVAGENHSCGRPADGSVYCWGNASAGALGNGQNGGTSLLTPTLVAGTSGFIYLYAGNARSCGIKADFVLWCWGSNTNGALGDNSTLHRLVPTPVAFTGYAIRFSSSGATCGLTNTTQMVLCWGANSQGQVGDGTTSNRLVPTLVTRTTTTAGLPAAITPEGPTGAASIPVNTASDADGAGVKLRDGFGTPIAGATITFEILGGGGSFSNGQSTMTATTDASGIARTGVVTSGAAVGLWTIRASTPGVFPDGTPGLVRHVFPIYVTPAVATITKLTGDNIFLTGQNASVVTVPLRVQLRDGSNNPVSNVGVDFVLGSNSGSSIAGNAVSILTDAQGIAEYGPSLWTPSTVSGSQSVMSVEVSGQAPVIFTATRSAFVNSFVDTSCELTAAGAAYCWGYGNYGGVGNGTTATATTPVAVSGGLTFSSLATGVAAHKCGLVGTAAYCWGLNDAGQLGDGTSTNRNVPTAVSGGLTFSQLAVSGSATCGLTTTSALYCWGWAGTAGFGTEESRGTRVLTPTLINTGGVTFVTIGLVDDGVCGLTAAGTLHCRGAGSRGMNLDGSFDQRIVFTQASGGPWKDFSATYLGICAIAMNDRAFCGGQDQSLGALGTGTVISTIRSGLQEVVGGISFASLHNYHFGACGRRTNGEVYCWGSNAFGQTGGGTNTLVLQPKLIPGVTFSSVRPQAFRAVCGKATNNQLYCWGQNNNGQLGQGSTDTNNNPWPRAVNAWPEGPAAGTAIGILNGSNTVASVIVGNVLTPAPSVLLRDRANAPVVGANVTFTVVSGTATLTGATVATDANGRATLGSLTAGSTAGEVITLLASTPGVPSLTFTITVVPGAASIAATQNTTQYSSQFETSSRNGLQVLVRDASNNPIVSYPVVYTVTSGGGTIAGGSSTTVLTNASGIASITSWSTANAAATHTLTATAQGLTPVTFTMVKVTNYGGRNGCRLNAAGAAFCWGENFNGELGDNTTTNRTVPTAVSGGITFASLAVGARSRHNCGLTAAGVAYCWGLNTTGELGDGTQTQRNAPVAVSGGHTFTKLFKGIGSTCGLKTGTGALYCWGWGSSSRYGDGTVGDIKLAPSPVNTNGLTFTHVALAYEGTCGVTATNGVHCWSIGPQTNMLGDNLGSRSIPSTTPISGLAAVQVEASDRAYCAVTTGSTLRCWGEGSEGQLATGGTFGSAVPIAPAVLGSNIAEVRFNSWTNACARTTSGQLYCWGNNASGQIGDGTTTNRLSPVLVGDGMNVTGFLTAAGSDAQMCARTAAGGSFCWGLQPIGDNTTSNRNIPTLVLFPEGTAGTAVSMAVSGSSTFSAASGVAVSPAPSVRVVDFAGNPVAGVTVTFAQGTGTGTITGGSAVTNASGIATVGSWALTTASGTSGTLRATATGLPTVVFSSSVP